MLMVVYETDSTAEMSSRINLSGATSGAAVAAL